MAYSTQRQQPEMPIHWIGSSLDDLRLFPEPVQDVMGYALYLAQCGERHAAAKSLRGQLRGMMQVSESHLGNAFRVVYTNKLRGAVYVLHAFLKKSKHGKATPRADVDLIQRRYHLAQRHYESKGE